MDELIAAAVKVKTMTVADDRLEAGLARHSISATRSRTQSSALRGIDLARRGSRSVAGGGDARAATGRFSEAEHLRVLTLLGSGACRYGLARPGCYRGAMRSDKKRRRGGSRFVLPRAIGDVEYGVVCNVVPCGPSSPRSRGAREGSCASLTRCRQFVRRATICP